MLMTLHGNTTQVPSYTFFRIEQGGRKNIRQLQSNLEYKRIRVYQLVFLKTLG